MLVFGEMVGVIVLGTLVIAGLISLLVIIDLLTFRIGVGLFRRKEVLSRLA